MGRPKGTYNEGLVRHRIRVLLADGRPRTSEEIARDIGDSPRKVLNAIHMARSEGELSSRLVYSLSEPAVQAVSAGPARAWFDV